ncbi:MULTISPECIES: hypothetical protein [Pseudoalteromonas]|uniref:hypothetical protein n=1 Tax=Pseudoalteromonas TaxID=53246 RepID=UPI00249A8CC2|nr:MULTISPECIES: hypothetical protein [Pseudoalteromonas]MCP4055753.1 hypothetical protein [Pseudoalteromonas sp.]MDI3247029.1 hypothetical protein [Pseudoalteromonas agarivorans]WRU74866.1 hypothetical protein VOI46_19355 [Pseudoalteromonas sp. CuT 4-3]
MAHQSPCFLYVAQSASVASVVVFNLQLMKSSTSTLSKPGAHNVNINTRAIPYLVDPQLAGVTSDSA